ncbi:heme ABC exporter ATP-binding protein CcmA [Glycocaulis sp.]|uniref:heme ABC exporter ATP-binding protein CcmA n=1 Tax=Glycocaulis sp. TaxID=1969725 RepID=UPI0025B8EB9D|nr:heme ABC exporter ATP-binding protein CcmA [Glycocaulis sp.]MCH8520981.1 heme ABC exporter ATP-binding protein CcmA [Glycocaulis sp.]
MSMPAALQVSNLALSRGGRTLLRGLSIMLEAGEALVLTGPNGTGKTTLLRAIAGLVRPDEGDIIAPPLAYLGHGEALKPSETVIDAISFAARLHGHVWGDGKGDVRMDALNAMGLSKRVLHTCGQLSAGQKRRLAIARLTLQEEARLWLMDEPAAPLDAAGRALLADLVADFRKGGGMVIAATHTGLGWTDAQALELRP